MGGGHVVAGAHHDVEPGAPGDAGEGQRIACQPPVGGIHDGLAARVLEQEDLVPGHPLVEQPKIVEVRVEVLADPAEVLEADRPQARPLSLAAAGSTNMTPKSMRRCSWGSVTPIASGAMAPSTVWM